MAKDSWEKRENDYYFFLAHSRFFKCTINLSAYAAKSYSPRPDANNETVGTLPRYPMYSKSSANCKIYLTILLFLIGTDIYSAGTNIDQPTMLPYCKHTVHTRLLIWLN